MTGLFRPGVALASATLVLWGCGTFPLPRVYVLGEPSQSTAGVVDEAGLAHIDVKTVTVPDYLDTTEIIRRSASNEIVTSATGRWGERLSAGITDALATDLARRLPNMVVESQGDDAPSRRVLVEVERFEIGEDGRCALTARWRVAAPGKDVPSDSELGTFIDRATSDTDAADALAMTLAIDQLSGQVAVTVQASR